MKTKLAENIMKKTIFILSFLALTAGGCKQAAKQQTETTDNEIAGKQNLDTEQSQRKVKHFFSLDGKNAVCFDDGTAFSCYDYYDYERGAGNIEPEKAEPNTTYKECDNYLLIGKDEKWNLFDDSGRIVMGWNIINYHKVHSYIQLTNILPYTNEIPADSIQAIKETCLIVLSFEQQHFDDEESEEAQAYFTIADDWLYYTSETITRFKEMGIKDIIHKKRYLSFMLYDGEKIIIDTKEKQNGTVYAALLYRKGYIPIMIDIVGSDEETEHIESYLSESGDGMP